MVSKEVQDCFQSLNKTLRGLSGLLCDPGLQTGSCLVSLAIKKGTTPIVLRPSLNLFLTKKTFQGPPKYRPKSIKKIGKHPSAGKNAKKKNTCQTPLFSAHTNFRSFRGKRRTRGRCSCCGRPGARVRWGLRGGWRMWWRSGSLADSVLGRKRGGWLLFFFWRDLHFFWGGWKIGWIFDWDF